MQRGEHFPQSFESRRRTAHRPRSLAMADAMRPVILCVASYFKGERFLERCKQEGARVLLLTAENCLGEAWPRTSIDEIFALPNFQDRRQILNAVTYLARTRPFRRIVALDDFDVELVAF